MFLHVLHTFPQALCRTERSKQKEKSQAHLRLEITTALFSLRVFSWRFVCHDSSCHWNRHLLCFHE